MKEFAPGIKDRSHFPELPHISEPTKAEFVIHDHEAKRKGRHFDVRIGIGDKGFSWAANSLPKPGDSTYVVEQPVHSLEYFDFKGEIPEGYGAGKVDIHDRGKVEVVKSSPGHISFNTYRGYGPEEYTLHRIGDKMWKLYNRTPSKDKLDLPLYRPDYKETKMDHVSHFGDDYIMSAKIDDAHQLFHFGKSGDPIRALSYRESKRHPSGLIEHTHKLDLPEVPKELANTVARGGIYAIDKRTGVAMQNALLGGLLNSNVWKSREQQKELGKLKTVIYDIEKYKGKDVSDLPYEDKLALLIEINKEVPHLAIPAMAHSKEEKDRLLKEIREGKHPETSEGVVLQHLKESRPPIKAKIFQEHDVYIKGFFSGEGKYKDVGVGGFYYSHTPDGEIAGKVGTGLSDELRKDMHRNQEKYKDAVAVVTAQEKYSSGALRVPAFKNWHIEKNPDRLDDLVKK